MASARPTSHPAVHETEPLLQRRNHPTSNEGHYPEGASHSVIFESVIPVTADESKRRLGLLSAVSLVFNRIIGTGVFASPSVILKSSGSVGLTFIMWMIGALVSAAGTAVYVEFGTGLPRSGGEKTYLEYIFRRPEFLITCIYAFYGILLGQIPAASIAFGEYSLHAVGSELTAANVRVVAGLCIIVCLVVHGIFPTFGIKLQDMLGAFKLAILLLISVCGLFSLIGMPGFSVGEQYDQPHNFTWTAFWEGSNTSTSAFVNGIYVVIWSYIGYSNANYALSEVQDPVRTIKRAAPLAMILVTAIYILVNVAYYAVVSKADILDSSTIAAALFFRNLFGPATEQILSALIALSIFGNILAVLFAQGRVNQELGREGILPWSHILASNEPFNAPLYGLLIQSLVSFITAVLTPAGDAYAFIVNYTSYPISLFNLLISGGLLLLYTRAYKPYNWDPPFRAPSYAVVFFFLSNVFLVVVPVIPPAPGYEVYRHLPYYIAGMASKVFEHPFDLTKVRLQAQVLDSTARFSGPIDCLVRTWRSEGVRGLYRGLPAPVVGAMAENASLFLAYNEFQNLFRPFYAQPVSQDPALSQLALASACAGAVTSFVLTPIELVKCKMQVQMLTPEASVTFPAGHPTPTLGATPIRNNALPGPISVFMSIIRNTGVRGLWLGQTGTLIRETGGTAAWFTCKEFVGMQLIRRRARSTGVDLGRKDILPWESAVSGACAGGVFNLSLFPADTVKSVMQTEEELRPRGKGVPAPTFFGTAKAMYKAQGIRGLYAGTSWIYQKPTYFSGSTGLVPGRTYASKSKVKSTAALVPGSQQLLTSEDARLEYKKAETKMSSVVEWYRREVASFETRASGRVTPALLSPVRVEAYGKGSDPVKLEEVATVGVKDGSMLLVTVFDEHNMKAVEQGIYSAKLPNIVPQKQDSRTIRIPIPKPTVEARTALVSNAQRLAEDARVQIRRVHQSSVKKGKYQKHSIELDEFQKLADKNIAEVDKILEHMKKLAASR
ncbi:hypothetical protein ID866_3754 [Astraeus odoratus]|nr:hypothetical protein ID866_3754 [Astraeus odoratus]